MRHARCAVIHNTWRAWADYKFVSLVWVRKIVVQQKKGTWSGVDMMITKSIKYERKYLQPWN